MAKLVLSSSLCREPSALFPDVGNDPSLQNFRLPVCLSERQRRIPVTLAHLSCLDFALYLNGSSSAKSRWENSPLFAQQSLNCKFTWANAAPRSKNERGVSSLVTTRESIPTQFRESFTQWGLKCNYTCIKHSFDYGIISHCAFCTHSGDDDEGAFTIFSPSFNSLWHRERVVSGIGKCKYPSTNGTIITYIRRHNIVETS